MNLDQIDEALKINLSVKLNSVLRKRKEHKAAGGSKKDFVNSVSALEVVRVA